MLVGVISSSLSSKRVGLTCGGGLVGAVESSVSTRRRADVHVEEDGVTQSEAAAAAAAFIWFKDGLFLTVCWLTSEGKDKREVQRETEKKETRPTKD